MTDADERDGVFKVDFRDGTVLAWRRTADGVRLTRTNDYAPSLYVTGPDGPVADLRARLADDPKVVAMGVESWRTGLRARTPEPALRVDLDRVREVRTLAHEIRHHHERGRYAPGTFRLFNVDFSPQFRYCLDAGVDPATDYDLTTLSLAIGEKPLADGDVSRLRLDGERVAGPEDAVLRAVHHRVAEVDPDVLLVSHGDLVPLLFDRADALEVRFRLGRLDGWTRLAGTNTVESYGQVGHSPARYNVPGRVLVDLSNSFLYHQSGLAGLRYLVAASGKPLQETGWASIGNVLTAIQLREALRRGALVPWNKWKPERFKDAHTLHAADRGGFTFEPRVGCHEGVAEVDFSSLYPRIIVERNVSPETTLCDCHADRADVPELGYNVCDRDGFLPDVLRPLLADRRDIKDRLAADDYDDPAERAAAEEVSDAIKWILVSCFGYQGYRNSKFGRIENHEAINAYARDILLRAKEYFEGGGWEVVHGIVDSLWVRPVADDHDSLDDLTDDIADDVGIPLDFEHTYDWVCFVPQRGADAGALTKYFGKVADADEYKIRGIELRQRSTPAFVADVQRDLIETFDRYREPGPVVDRLRRHLDRLRAGDVPADDLVVRKRVSKRRDEYAQRTQTVAALERAAHLGLSKHPGQDVRYVVVNDDARSMDRVRLQFEAVPRYDADFYADLAVRACESVVSPVGWDEARIRRHLRDGRDVGLAAFD